MKISRPVHCLIVKVTYLAKVTLQIAGDCEVIQLEADELPGASTSLRSLVTHPLTTDCPQQLIDMRCLKD